MIEVFAFRVPLTILSILHRLVRMRKALLTVCFQTKSICLKTRFGKKKYWFILLAFENYLHKNTMRIKRVSK